MFKDRIGKKLHELGIDLNGIENGVWLPSKDYAGRTASLHRGNHLGELVAVDGEILPSYVEEVRRRLSGVRTKEKALQIIDQLRDELLNSKGKLYNEPR